VPTPSPALPESVRAFLQAPRIATIATVGPDGEPHQAAIWYRLEPDDRILVNSSAGRRWPRELEATGRCSLSIIDAADEYRWLSLQADLDDVDRSAAAREDIVALSIHYHDYSDAGAATFRAQDRVTYRLRVAAVHAELGE
jgi:PPOX class probable F420-dependent enzyme